MVKFLKFMKADAKTCMADFEDAFVAQLQKSMQEVKDNREMERRYMRLELLLYDERKKAKIEERANAIVDILEQRGVISELLKDKIRNETDMKVLREWFDYAINTNSLEKFEKKLKNYE